MPPVRRALNVVVYTTDPQLQLLMHVQVLKFIAYSSNGVAPVEFNPAFVEQMKEVRSTHKVIKLVLACATEVNTAGGGAGLYVV